MTERLTVEAYKKRNITNMQNKSIFLIRSLWVVLLMSTVSCGSQTVDSSSDSNRHGASKQGLTAYNYGPHAIYSWPVEVEEKHHFLGMEARSSRQVEESTLGMEGSASESWHEPSILPWMPEEWSVENVRGSISNGSLQIQLTNTHLSVGVPKHTGIETTPSVVPLIGQLYFSGKVDGRKELLSTEDFSRIKGSVKRDAAGTTLVLEKLLKGGGKGVESTETIRLHPSLPVFDYTLTLKNTTDNPITLTLTHGSGAAQIFYAGEFLEGRKILYVDRQSPREGVLDDKVAWLSVQAQFINPCAWATVTDDNGYVLGVSTRKDYRRLFGAETKWIFPENRMVLDLPAEVEARNGRPIELPAGESVQTGLIIYALPYGGNRNVEIGQAFEDRMKGEAMSFESPYTLIKDGEVLSYASVSGLEALHQYPQLWHVLEGSVEGESDSLKLRTNEQGKFRALVAAQFAGETLRVRMDAKSVADGAELTLWAVGKDGTKELCGKLKSTGQVDETLKLGGEDSASKAFIVEMTGTPNSQATMSYFYAGLPKPVAPELQFPINQARHIQAGVSFRWGTVPDVLEYRLELAQNPEFEQPITHTISYTAKEALFGRPDRGAPGDAGFFPLDRLALGKWYWRVAAVGKTGASPYSEVREFDVVEAPSNPQPRFALGSSNFLFCSTFNTGKDAGTLDQLSKAVGPKLAPHMANRIVLETMRSLRSETWEELFTSLAGAQDQYMIWPGHSGLDLAVFETALQRCPNIIGFTQGELFWGFWQFPERREFTRRVLEISAAYGAVFIWGDGQEGAYNWLRLSREPKWKETLREFGHALVPNWKMNLMTAQYTTQGAILGMQHEGLVEQTGVWPENFYWSEAGYGPKIGDYYGKQKGKTKDMPDVFWLQNFLLGTAQGSVTYVNHDAKLIHDHLGKPSSGWKPYFEPFFAFLRDYPVIPDRETVQRMSLDVEVPSLSQIPYTHQGYGAFQALYEVMYGVQKGREWIDLLPATESYRPLALLTEAEGQVPRLLDLRTPQAVASQFKATEKPKADTAWAYHDGQRVFLMNPAENEDLPARFKLELSESSGIRFQGNIAVHTLWMSVETEEGIEVLLLGRSEAPPSSFTFYSKKEYEVRKGDEVVGKITAGQPFKLNPKSTQYPYRLRFLAK